MPAQQDINEIASYLKSFEDGTRKHDQKDFHSDCGTSHCLAGWKLVEDYEQQNGEIKDWNYRWSDSLEEFLQSLDPDYDEWQYAQNKWGLSIEEADSLFYDTLSLVQMKENLKSIAVSHGLTYAPN